MKADLPLEQHLQVDLVFLSFAQLLHLHVEAILNFTGILNERALPAKSPVANEINTVEQKATAEGSVSGNNGTYDETTFDGYQDIMKANGRMRREDELKKMKEARLKNRSSAPVGGETKKLE